MKYIKKCETCGHETVQTDWLGLQNIAPLRI